MADGTISKVEFYNGAVLLVTDVSAPYSYTWTGVAAGTYSLTAKAYDNSNAVANSTAINATVTGIAVNQAPQVNISSPINNASFSAPASIAISANASDADGSISKVEFYNGAVLLGTDVSAPYSYTLTGVAAGTYSLTAKAFDNQNAAATSTATTVVVTDAVVGNVGDCAVLDLTSTAWVLRNNWSDQGNGSVLTNDAGALKVSHRQWGANYFWLISTTKYALTAGTSYTVSYDLMGSFAIASTEVGIAGSYGNEGPVLAQPSAAAPVGYTTNAYNNKSLSFVPAASGTYSIAVKVNLVAQPSAVASFYLKNLKNCSATGNANQLPLVSLTSPAGGASFTAPASIAISANASDADGSISKVEFYNGTVLLGTDVSAPYSYTLTGVAAGTYSLTAKAFDNQNATATSTATTVVVTGAVIGNVGDCAVLDLTSTAWVLRNNWSDQGNGSVLTNDAGALKVSHRRWGANYFWLISTTKYALKAGTSYTVSYDLMGSFAIASTEVGIAGSYGTAGPNLLQPSGVAPAGYVLSTYGSKSVTIVPTASGTYSIAIKVNLIAQPSVVATYYLRNLKNCPTVGTFKTGGNSVAQELNSITNELMLYPNPAQHQITLQYEGESVFELYNVQGQLVLKGNMMNSTSIDVSSYDSGIYMLVVTSASGREV
ncbi:MAG: Ig-like domain-containing protein [Flavobacteriales bacterium]